ncbi:MAG: N-6 DNA methylase, partial [Treponema sp.]|nr:N-6 DNA methylase [Treponema sp.]
MTNDGDFYKFLVRLQEFIKEKNRVQFYNASDIQFYIFLYILYQFQKEGIELNSDCLSNWESLDIPKELKAAFYKELKILPTLSEDTIQICSQNNIVHFFYSITFISSCSLQRSESLFWLVHSLLIYSHEDNFADFYGNEFFVEQLSKSAFCESYTCFTASLEDWIFRKIKNQITNKFPKYILKNYDLIEKAINKEVSEDFKFSKIYAFPPFYQKTNEWSKANNVRIVSNTIRGSQDRTEDFVEFIVDSLKDEGQAVVLLSNSIFNRDYADFQKKLIEEKYLTKIINLPQGAVYPNNISASIFVFKKCNNNFGIHFVDLRSFELEVSGSSEIGAFNRIEEKFIKDLLRIKKSAYTAFASYAEIFSNGNNLNSSYYITNTGFKHQAIAGEKFYGEDTENLGYTIRMNNLVVAEYSLSYQKSASQGKDFILAEEAQIFRGF